LSEKSYTSQSPIENIERINIKKESPIIIINKEIEVIEREIEKKEEKKNVNIEKVSTSLKSEGILSEEIDDSTNEISRVNSLENINEKIFEKSFEKTDSMNNIKKTGLLKNLIKKKDSLDKDSLEKKNIEKKESLEKINDDKRKKRKSIMNILPFGKKN
jgi:hypothetical protein